MLNLHIFAAAADTKKFLITLAVILLVLVVLLGLIVDTIKKAAKRKAEEIDLYLVDMCRFQILKTPKEVMAYAKKRETKRFYLKNRITLRVFLAATIAFVVLVLVKFEGDFKKFIDIIWDLHFEYTWPKADFFGIHNFPVGWPELTKASVVHLDFEGYVAYVYFAVLLFTLIYLMVTIISLSFRLLRARDIKVRVFNKSVDMGINANPNSVTDKILNGK